MPSLSLPAGISWPLQRQVSADSAELGCGTLPPPCSLSQPPFSAEVRDFVGPPPAGSPPRTRSVWAHLRRCWGLTRLVASLRNGDSLLPHGAFRVLKHCQSRVGKNLVSCLFSSQPGRGECWDSSVPTCTTHDASWVGFPLCGAGGWLSGRGREAPPGRGSGMGAATSASSVSSAPGSHVRAASSPCSVTLGDLVLPQRCRRGGLHPWAAFPQSCMFRVHFRFVAFEGRFAFGRQPVRAR